MSLDPSVPYHLMRLAIFLIAVVMVYATCLVLFVDLSYFYSLINTDIELRDVLLADEDWQTQIAVFNTAFGSMLRSHQDSKDDRFTKLCSLTGRNLIMTGVFMALFSLLTHSTAHIFVVGMTVNIIELAFWPLVNIYLAILLLRFITLFAIQAYSLPQPDRIS